ncbi:MAG: leucine-rich repeat protein [Lachnospiraceae bacterium]|nr:leucine-rich repeat protein [Lachnospiraceae bacterium]
MFSGFFEKYNHHLTKILSVILVVLMLCGSVFSGSETVKTQAKSGKASETSETDATETEETKIPEVGDEFTVSRLKYTVIAAPEGDTPGKVAVTGNSLKKKTTTVTIPWIVTYNGGRFFVYEIGDYAFVGSGIKSIDFEDEIYAIGEYAFAMSSLESFVIPETVTEIKAGAFALCGSLTSVSIGRYTTSIAQNAFSYCDSLSEITVAAKNKSYSADAGILYNKKKTLLISGAGASGDVVLPKTVKKLSAYAFEGNHKITSVDLGTVITKIPEDVFYDCSALERIVIGKNITKITGNPFKYCASLKYFDVDEENTKYKSTGPMLCSKSGLSLYAYPSAKGSHVIPSSVKNIGEYAFCGSALTELQIPSNVKTVAKGAFYDCTDLEEVTFEKRKITIYPDIASTEDMIFGNAKPYLVIVLPYSKDAGSAGSIEETLKLNCPSTVIIVNK